MKKIFSMLALMLFCSTVPLNASARTVSATNTEVRLLALLADAEAGNQPEKGQRLVIDTVLNRVDDVHFPDTITAVIYQRNQFSPVQSGSIWRRRVKPEMVKLVREELKHRTNDKVVFFRMWRYGPYGSPMFRIGDHYFSSYV